MRAVVSHPHTTAPEVIEVEPPELGHDEVAVDVIAAAVNPVDPFVATGAARAAFGLDGTVGLGWDVSGRVVAVGGGVTSLAVGDLVAGLDDRLAAPTRAQAERVVLPADSFARVPAGLDPVEAASIPLNSLTAAQALAILGDPAGRTLLVTGAGGAVGGYAVALASAAGWQVTGLARATDREFVVGAGATEVLTDLGDRRFDAVLDPAVLREAALAATADGGHYVGVQPAFPLAAERGVTVAAVLVRPDRVLLGELLERSRAGDLAVRVAGTAALDEAASIYDKVAGGGQRGRWLLLP